MDDNFKKLKRKYLLGALIKSALCGVAAGLALSGILLLSFKLGKVECSVIYYIIAGVGAALLAGGVAFFIMRPTDKRVAKKLDCDYSLNERAQTSLAFAGESGAIVELQRADAGEKLAGLSVPVVSISRLWKFIAVFALSAAIAVAGIAVPGGTASAGPGILDDNAPAQITDAHKIRLEELIANVNKSNLKAALKTPIAESLQDLRGKLDTKITNGKLRAAVEETRETVLTVTTDAATYVSLSQAFADLGEANFADALSGGGDTYLYYDALSYDDVESFFNEKMYAGVDQGFSLKFEAFRNQFIIVSEDEEEDNGEAGAAAAAETSDLATTKAAISAAATQLIVGAMSLGTEAINSDDLCKRVVEFAGKLNDVAALKTETLTELQNALIDAFGTGGINISNTLGVQTYGRLAGRYVRNALAQIFSEFGFKLELAERRPSDVQGGDGQGGHQGDDNQGGDGQGGSGTGDVTYGSADQIYDPETGTYVKYGDLLNRYYAMAAELMGTDRLTPDQEAAIERYFSTLFGISAGN